jgi:hypothetical protein
MKQFAFVLFIVLLRLENYSPNIFFKVLPLVLLIPLVVQNFYTAKKIRDPFKLSLFLYLYILLLSIGVIRNNNPNMSALYDFFKLFSFYLIVIAFIQTVNKFLLQKNRNFFDLFFWTIFLPFFGLIVANILGYLLGLNPNKISEVSLGQALFLNQLGINIERVNFPFSPGYNSYSIIVGVLLMISLFGLIYIKKHKILMILGILFSTATILLIDTRSALLYPFVIFISLFFITKKTASPRLLWLIPLICVFGSTLMLLLLNFAAQIPALSFLARSSDDFETGNARSFIWLQSSLEFINFKSIHLIGYGEFGHYKSGASSHWAGLFSRWGDSADFATPHSSFYSILFDYGYIGLGVILLLQYKFLAIIKKNWKEYRELCTLMLAFILYYNLIGVTETAQGFYSPNMLTFFIIFSIFVFMIEHLSKKKSLNKLN